MKYRLSTIGASLLLLAGAASAVNGSGYYNLVSVGTYGSTSYTYYLVQSDESCSTSTGTFSIKGVNYTGNGAGILTSATATGYPLGGAWSYSGSATCLASVKDTPDNLYDLLDTAWINYTAPTYNNATYTYPGASTTTADIRGALQLGTDIDLGEFSSTTAEGECVVQHKPLPAVSGKSFITNGYSIKNLCYTSSVMSEPVGFFSKIESGQFNNLKFDGVRILINGSSSDGADYYPAGALAGVIELATVDTITVANAVVDAPFAGAAAGFINNSTFKNVTIDDDVVVQNSTVISGTKSAYPDASLNTSYKVFLGGLAGAMFRSNTDQSLINASLKVEVKDLTGSNKSALGGVVGVLKAYAETLTGIKVYTKTGATGESLPSRISGGSSMGGLLGHAVFYSATGSNYDLGDIVLENCFFEGEIGNAASPDSIAVGGLVGRDVVGAGVSMKIVNSEAKLTFNDSLEKSGSYHYFAGGLLGVGGDCLNSTNDAEDFISIMGSKTSGSMNLAANGAAIDGGVHVQAVVGGIAGKSCFASNGNGLKNDTSSMKISVNVRSSQTTSYSLDSVNVGGIVGSADMPTSKDDDVFDVHGISFTGSLSVVDGLNATHVGGVVGSFASINGGSAISFDSSYVGTMGKMSSTLISYKAMEASKTGSAMQVASIGGVCGNCDRVESINEVGVIGKITVEGSYSGDSLLVGGLLGDVYKSAQSFYIHNNFTIGDISVNVTTSAVVDVGYLVGKAHLNERYTILADYHYSDNDDIEPFGLLYHNGDITSGWKTSDSIHYVVRNGSAQKYTEKHHNGTETSANMKKDSTFAAFLNAGIKKHAAEEELVWTYAEGSNNELPFFKTLLNDAIISTEDGTVLHTVTFKGYNPDSLKVAVIKTQKVEDGKAATAPTAEWVGRTYTWDIVFSNVTSDTTVTAVYTLNSYDVTFEGCKKDGEDQIVSVEYGSKVTPPTDCEFGDGVRLDSWNDTSAVITEATTMTPVVSYRVTYVVGDVTREVWLPSGTDMTIEGDASATRETNEKYSYSFKDWDPKYGVLTGPATYTAVFDSTGIPYTISFVNPDNTVAAKPDTVAYGEPISLPSTAKMSGNDSVDYSFTGWKAQNPEDYTTMPAMDLEFLAEYKATVKKYEVSFKDYDDSLLLAKSVAYGSKASAPEEYTPKNGSVRLIGWNDTSAVIRGETSIKAVVEFKVTFKYGDKDTVLWLENGTVMTPYSMVTPSRKDSAGYKFEFDGWNQTFTTLEGPTTYVAQYVVTKIVASSSSVEVTPASSSSEPVVEPASSSSVEVVVATGVKVSAEKGVEQSGNAIRVAYAVEIENPGIKTEVYVVLDESVTYPIADSLETETLEGEWVLAPAPQGKHSVKVVVTNGVESESANAGEFNVATEIAVAPKAWKMVSLAEADGNLADLASKTSIYWWDESNAIGDYWQYRAFDGDDFDATIGFWYGSSVGKSIALREGVATSEFEWKLDSLYSGWNMVSNPTGWTVSLDGVLKNEDVLQVRSWNAETGAYDLATELKPYEAVWVQVKRPTRVTVDATPYFGAEEKNLTSAQKVAALRKGAARKASAKNWSVLAVLKDRSGKSDSWNMIGAGTQEESLDKAPMGMGDYIRLAIMDGKNKLSKSVKAVADEYEWDMKLSAATARDAELSFDGVEALNQAGLAMTVTINGKTQEVKAGSPVKVALTKNTTVATVRVAPAATLASNKLTGFAVAQVADGLQIGFDAPESLAGANASYALVAVNGKKIASGSFKATAGSNSLNLKVPQSGLYFIQMKIGSQRASAKVMVK